MVSEVKNEFKMKDKVCSICGKKIGRFIKFHDRGSGEDFCSLKCIREHKRKKPKLTDEQEMANIGYYVGEMCPFTQVKVGGTTNVSSAVLFGAPTTDEFIWTHGKCLGKYCAIWDEKHKQCSIKTIANKKDF